MTYKAVYSRHMRQYVDDAETLDEAIGILQHGRDYGLLFQICIVDDAGKVYLEEGSFIDISDEIPTILKKLNIPYTDERGTFELG